MRFHFADIVGTYQLVVSDELREFVERAFVLAAPPEEREAVRAEALHEAAGAELEVQADGTVISRSHGQEFYRLSPGVPDGELTEVRFEKAPGQTVVLTMRDADTVLAAQLAKPIAEFRRKQG